MFYNYTEKFSIRDIDDFFPNTLSCKLFMLDELLKIRGCSSKVILSSGMVHNLMAINKIIDPCNKENIYSFTDFWNKDIDFFLLPNIEEGVFKYRDFTLFQWKLFDFLNPRFLFEYNEELVFITESSYRECVLDVEEGIAYTTKNYLKSVESDEIFPPSWYDGTVQSMHTFLADRFEEPFACLCRYSSSNKSKISQEMILYLNCLLEYVKESLGDDLFHKYMTRFYPPQYVRDFIDQNDFSDLWKSIIKEILSFGYDHFEWEKDKLEEAYRNETRVCLWNHEQIRNMDLEQ